MRLGYLTACTTIAVCNLHVLLQIAFISLQGASVIRSMIRFQSLHVAWIIWSMLSIPATHIILRTVLSILTRHTVYHRLDMPPRIDTHPKISPTRTSEKKQNN